MDDVVLLVLTWARRGKFEIPPPIKFNPRRIACGGKRVRPIQKLERFGQSPLWLGRVSQRGGDVCHLKGRPINESCQWRDHEFKPPNDSKLSDRRPSGTLECNRCIESPAPTAEAQAGRRFAPVHCQAPSNGIEVSRVVERKCMESSK